MASSPLRSGLMYQLIVGIVLLYVFRGWWIPSLLIVGYVIHQLWFKSTKIEGSERWNAIVIGAGFGGLDMAIKLKDIGVHFTILEKSEKLGGTWWDNQYPGAACDVPSHLYSLSYDLNPWWPRAYSLQSEIRDYLEDLASKYHLNSYIHCLILCRRSKIFHISLKVLMFDIFHS